ncbi:MAG: hypothetical protein Q9190_007656 [Brigantiaea leucoxantha]
MGKRKADSEYSANQFTQRERKRRAKLNPQEKIFENRKKADQVAETRAIKRLKESTEYQSASKDQRIGLERATRQNVQQKRLEQGKSASLLDIASDRRQRREQLIVDTRAAYQQDDGNDEWVTLKEDVDENVQRDFDIINGDIIEAGPPPNIDALKESGKAVNQMLWRHTLGIWQKAIIGVSNKGRVINRAHLSDGTLLLGDLWVLVPKTLLLELVPKLENVLASYNVFMDETGQIDPDRVEAWCKRWGTRRDGTLSVKKIWDKLPSNIRKVLLRSRQLRQVPRASYIFTQHEAGVITNVLAWYEHWQAEWPFDARIWEYEEDKDWLPDGVYGSEDIFNAFKLCQQVTPITAVPEDTAYRFVLPDGKYGTTAFGPRLSLTPEGVVGNGIWMKPPHVWVHDDHSNQSVVV